MSGVFASEAAELMTKSPKQGLFIPSVGFVIPKRGSIIPQRDSVIPKQGSIIPLKGFCFPQGADKTLKFVSLQAQE